MSFTSYAISLIKNNRRLQRSIKKAYPSKKISGVSKHNYPIKVSKDYTDIDNLKKYRIIKFVFIILFLSIGLTFLGLKIIDTNVFNFNNSYYNSISKAKDEAIAEHELYDYNFLVKNANRKFNKGEIELAKVEFTRAIKIKRNGKKGQLWTYQMSPA